MSNHQPHRINWAGQPSSQLDLVFGNGQVFVQRGERQPIIRAWKRDCVDAVLMHFPTFEQRDAVFQAMTAHVSRETSNPEPGFSDIAGGEL